jgi:hypothetical protein
LEKDGINALSQDQTHEIPVAAVKYSLKDRCSVTNPNHKNQGKSAGGRDDFNATRMDKMFDTAQAVRGTVA